MVFLRGRQFVSAGVVSALLLGSGVAVHAVEIPPENKAAIKRGVDYLRKNADKASTAGQGSLHAYAMLTGGVKPDDPAVAPIIQDIVNKVRGGRYTPEANHYYEAGVDMMVLEAADPIRYRPQMQAITDYILYGQKSGGQWYYPDGGGETAGDTSISQYALLGLWAAARSGLIIEQKVWDEAAGWHLRTQVNDGAYTYHYPEARPTSYHAMTAAAIGSLNICKMHLHPNAKNSVAVRQQPKKPTSKFGVLEKVDLDEDVPAAGGPYRVKTSAGALDGASRRAVGWLAANFRIEGGGFINWPAYYLYTLERAGSLSSAVRIGQHDWYAEGSKYLLETQEEDGSWDIKRGYNQDTSFAVLFLARATGKLIGPVDEVDLFGDGTTRSSAALKNVKDFKNLEVRNGEVQVKKELGPLDELLDKLGQVPNLDSLEQSPVNTDTVARGIVEKVLNGGGEELIGRRDDLLKLVKHSNPEVRKVAVWAFARTATIADLPIVMKALDDPNTDVVMEAHNALCFINRDPEGVGMPNSPLEGLPVDATEKQKAAATEKWVAEVRKRWKGWFHKIRRYEDRNTIEELGSH